MSSGNLGFVQLWGVLKDYLYVREPNGHYLLLHQVLVQHQDDFLLQPVLDLIGTLPLPCKKISESIIRNGVFELAGDLFL